MDVSDGRRGGEPELQQLYRGEFGEPKEVLVRSLLIAAAGIGHLAYIGGWLGPVWSTTYLISQGLLFLALTRFQPPYRRGAIFWAYLAYIVTTVIFFSLPAFLMTTDDVALSFCGAMGLIALGVFTLWREEPPKPLLYFDIGIGAAAAILALGHFLPLVDSAMERILMILVCLTAFGYYAMALIATREARVRLKAAARRGIEAQKMEAIGRLSGGVAHDFNNILTVLQGNLELYEEVTDPDERRRLVEEALSSAARAAGLVAQLLAFARRAPLTPSRIEAKTIIEELASMTRRLLPAGIAVYPSVPATRVCTLADHDQLISALLNLVLNARDAMAVHGEMTIAAAPMTTAGGDDGLGLAPGRYIKFSVSDTGPGMAPEVRDRALEPFFSTKGIGEGSGLGLSTANGFAAQSGGALSIDSSASGTTVSIYLPRVKPGAAPAAPTRPETGP